MKGRYPYGNGSQAVSAFHDVGGVPNYGDVYFVDSNGGGSADSNAGTKRNPCTTIASAVAQASSSHGDLVVCAPGHTEDISVAGGISIAKAGVKVIGTGHGSDRTTITFSETDSTLVISGANCTFENILFLNAKDGLVAPFTISVAYTTFINCSFNDAGTQNTTNWFTVTATGDDLTLINCVNKGTDTAGNVGFMTVAAAANLSVINLQSNGDFSAGNIVLTAAATDLKIDRNFLENKNAVDVNIEGFSNATGWIANCKCTIVTDGEVTWINTGGELTLFENYGVNEAGETGMLIGSVSAT
jgi:hypothetical protein